MKTLFTVTLAGTLAATLFSASVAANELEQQVRASATQQQSALHQASLQDARAALLKTAIEIQARQSAEQFASDLLALNNAQTNDKAD
jgi:hypothetical protein